MALRNHIWQLFKPNKFLVDKLALVRGLEAQGVPPKQADAITAAITQVLNDTLENVSHYSVSKAEMQKSEMIQESNLSKFKSEVQSSQEHRFLCCNVRLKNYEVTYRKCAVN